MQLGSIILVIVALTGILPLFSEALPTGSIRQGPYLNSVVYRVMDMDDIVLAIQENDIDLIGESLDPTIYNELESAEDIEIVSTPRNGFAVFHINCAKYPFNISAFRRAMAFAIDKESIAADFWEGLAYVQDCPIPASSVYSAEGLLDFTYYESDINRANQLLDVAGFLDIDSDDIREMPNGEDFTVLIEVSQSQEIQIQTGEAFAEVLHDIGINATSQPTDYYEYVNRLYFHGDFDIVLMEKDYGTDDIYEFAYDYWSEYADEPYWNFPNWINTSFDGWRDQLVHSVDYDEVYEAAIMMQRIWVEDCPGIIAYQNLILSAYRTNQLAGFVNSIHDGVPYWWTNFKVYHTDLPNNLGGALRIGTIQDIESFNFMTALSDHSQTVLMNMCDSLLRRSSDGYDIPWLAASFEIEVHDDNPTVSEGYTRFTFDIIQNATWSDGTPLTGEDVSFSLNYYRDSPGNTMGFGMSELTAAYASTTYTVIVEFQSESYWHLHRVGYKPILPKHIFEDIGLTGWNLWNPDPPEETMVTSGPFNVSKYEPNQIIELRYNPLYFYGLSDHPMDPTTSPSTMTITDTALPGLTDEIYGIPGLTILNLTVTIPSVLVIIIVLVKWKSEKPEMFDIG